MNIGKNFLLRAARAVLDNTDGDEPTHWEEFLVAYWAPRIDENWPGLAYCKPAARGQALRLLAGSADTPTDDEVALEVKELGLLGAKNPFVNKVEMTEDKGWLLS